jgi:hypothetical protein
MVTKMVDEEPDWMPLHEVIAHVEAIKECHRGKATQLVREAVDGLKVKSKTVLDSSVYRVWHLPGGEEAFSNGDGSIELWREDVFRMWPEHSREQPLPAQTASNAPPTRRRPRETGIVEAIRDIWPNGIPARIKPKERDRMIRAWLIEKGEKIEDKQSITRQIQRVFKEHPELLAPAGNSGAVERRG